eukprot:TRINITY_DN7161_c0_g1_i1.p1 TRINITY_DN7161_c0_g1~~TRINITY_DN7161_c0_g1_i1.p1  ORF type:complete len:436 (+),score=98.86 TRINITY_DN7161_c0_g1_i1:71-1378(+)
MSGDLLDPYNVLGLTRSATSTDVEAAFLDSALPHHPDIRLPGDSSAAAAFHRAAQAYWVLSDVRRRRRYDDGGILDLSAFDERSVLRACARGVFGSAGDLDSLVADAYQCHTPEDVFMRFAQCASQVGHRRKPWSPLQLSCARCGLKFTTRSSMQEHLLEVHAGDVEAWWDETTTQAKASFHGFMDSVLGIGAAEFALPTGLKVPRARQPAPPSGLQWRGEDELERALDIDDPSSSRAVARALDQAPCEARDAIARLRANDAAVLGARARPGVGERAAAYLAPVAGREPDLHLPYERPILVAAPPAPTTSAAAAAAAAPGAAAAGPGNGSVRLATGAVAAAAAAAATVAASAPGGGGGFASSAIAAEAEAKPAERDRRQHHRRGYPHLSASSAEPAGELGCSCGFSCGTREALGRHLARFAGDADAAQHHRALGT